MLSLCFIYIRITIFWSMKKRPIRCLQTRRLLCITEIPLWPEMCSVLTVLLPLPDILARYRTRKKEGREGGKKDRDGEVGLEKGRKDKRRERRERRKGE